ncbi:dimethylaniline monooxygenase 2 [Apiospora aurea]|uniref:Dimethylaniline monooxygenase 2 n=1 Tax=Apiospora aurea TaxID=335848 RepID=A0ABR1Q551_9PEZI
MDKVNIAVIGTGPAGLTALKTLREEGFNVIAFERRDRIGGLWSYSGNPAFTSVVDGTVCNISKFVSGFSDFPLPRGSPIYLSGAQVSGYFHSYATHFKLLEHVRFGTTVRKVLRNSADDGWDVHVTDADGDRTLPFHKVVFGSGNETIPSWPRLPGRDRFKGILIHGQAYKNPGQFVGKRVLVVGMGNTGSDIATALCNSRSNGHTSTTATTKVYHSYRRGRLMISRYEADGTPLDTKLSWPTMCLKYLLDAWLPRLVAPLIDAAMLSKMACDAARTEPPTGPDETPARRRKRVEHKVRHEWRLADFPSMSRRHPAVNEHWFPAVQTGTITPVRGLKGFVGGNEVLLDDGTVLEVDAVIVCTGYQYFDFNIMPGLEMDGANGPPLNTSGALAEEKRTREEERGEEQEEEEEELPHLPRLYHLIFPPQWADSIAFLSCFAPQEAVWNVCELASMAVAQIWAAETVKKDFLSSPKEAAPPPGYRFPATLPAMPEMNAQIDAYHAWWRGQWAQDHSTLPGFVQGNPFNRFLHAAAGTGLYEHVDHLFALRNWRLWWEDRELYTWLARGPINPCSYRLFVTNPQGAPGCGRRAWGGARGVLKNLYEDVEGLRRDAANKSATKSK